MEGVAGDEAADGAGVPRDGQGLTERLAVHLQQGHTAVRRGWKGGGGGEGLNGYQAGVQAERAVGVESGGGGRGDASLGFEKSAGDVPPEIMIFQYLFS